MKLSCLPVSLFEEYSSHPYGAAEWAEAALGLGLQGFDLSMLMVRNRTPAYLEELSSRICRLGITPVTMTTYPDFTVLDDMQRRREAAYCISDMALASQLGFKYLRITPGQLYEDLPLRAGIRVAIDSFFAMAEYAKRFDIKLLFENHTKPGAWTRFDLSCDPSVFLEICENIRGSGIGVLFDTGNAVSCGWEPLTLLDKVYNMVSAIHITDTLKFGEYIPCCIGQGSVPNREVIDELKHRGFDGWISVEEESENGLSEVMRACQYVKELLV